MINNFMNKFIRMILFFVNKSYYLWCEVESLKVYIKQKKAELEWADKIIARIKFIQQWLQKQIAWTQEKYKCHVNKIRQSYFEYHVEDQVYVDAHYFAAEKSSKSLEFKNTNSWKIIQVIDNKIYKLKFSEYLKKISFISIFHLWKLHLTSSNLYSEQIQESQLSILITESNEEESHEEWNVLKIMNCKETKQFDIQYKIMYIRNWNEWNFKSFC